MTRKQTRRSRTFQVSSKKLEVSRTDYTTDSKPATSPVADPNSSAGPIDIKPDHLRIVQDILREHLPADVKAWVFGNRADRTTKDSSDLNIALQDEDKLSHKLLDTLKNAFSDSTLPHTVNIVDLNSISGSLKQIVESQRVPLPINKDSTKQHTPPSNTPIGNTSQEETPPTTTGKPPRVSLDDLIDLQLSSVDKKSKANEQAVQLCNYMDVYNNNFIHSDMDFMAATATAREIEKCSLAAGDVIITKDSEKYDDIGVPALVREDVANLVCGYHLAILRPRLSKVNGAYLFYALSTREVQQQFHSFANGVTRFGLRKSDIGLVEIPVPSLPEQRAIAHILGTLDDKVELNRRRCETLEEMAQALFKSWFVDFDPVRAKAEGRDPGLPQHLADLFPDRFVESELGPIPAGWQIEYLSQIANHLRKTEDPRNSPTSIFTHFSIPSYDNGQTPVQQYGDLIKSHKTIVPPQAVLVSRLNPEIERTWLVDVRHGQRAVCSTEFLVLNAIKPFKASYVYCLARSKVFRNQLISLVTGTSKSHQRAPVKSVMNIRAATPHEKLLVIFNEHTEAILKEKQALHNEIPILTALRNALLPGLVSGKLGVESI